MQEPCSDLEFWMQKISLVTSVVSLGLMVFGFVDILATGTTVSMPGFAALPLLMFKSGSQIPLGLLTMSGGIVVLALLPILRVILALSLYLRSRQVLNVVVALLVFIELLVSARTGG